MRCPAAPLTCLMIRATCHAPIAQMSQLCRVCVFQSSPGPKVGCYTLRLPKIHLLQRLSSPHARGSVAPCCGAVHLGHTYPTGKYSGLTNPGHGVECGGRSTEVPAHAGCSAAAPKSWERYTPHAAPAWHSALFAAHLQERIVAAGDGLGDVVVGVLGLLRRDQARADVLSEERLDGA